jgi:hypothetical protein
MRGGARSRNHARSQAGRARRSVPAVALAVGAVLAVAGCADPTGEIDSQGHNGYDQMTCEQAKSLALDMQYGTVYAGSLQARISDLTTDAAKASHAQVRDAAMALITSYKSRSRAAVNSAASTLVKVCQM